MIKVRVQRVGTQIAVMGGMAAATVGASGCAESDVELPIDMDEVRQGAAVAPKPASATTSGAPSVAPVAVQPSQTPTQSPTHTAAAKPVKEKAPADTAQKKALEDLLEQLGEEQLKR